MQMKKREAPRPVSAVHLDGIRYEPVVFGTARGLSQNGGYIAAIEEQSGQELWVQKVYDIAYDETMEGDKQDVFVTGLAIDKNKRLIVVDNERGERFVVDIDSRRVAPA